MNSTEAKAKLDTYIPGDCLPGLLDGWCGPVEVFVSGCWQRRAWMSWLPRFPNDIVRLDTRREEVRDQVARVLARVLGIPVGATAPRFVLPSGCKAWVLSTGSVVHTHIFGAKEYSGRHPDRHTVPDLAQIPLDSPDRDAIALAIIARHVGKTLCP